MPATKVTKQSRARARTKTDAVIGRRLRNLRKAQGYTAQALARELDISFQSIHKYEAGHRIPASRLAKICRILDCSSKYFLDCPDTIPAFCARTTHEVEALKLLRKFAPEEHGPVLAVMRQMSKLQGNRNA